jgi:lipopolysaccharide transport system permease protein
MLISSLVTKYRDFNHLIGFGAIANVFVGRYPMALIAEMPKYAWRCITIHSPMLLKRPIYMLLNVGQISGMGLTYTIVVTVLYFYRIVDFNKTGRVL